MVKDRNIL